MRLCAAVALFALVGCSSAPPVTPPPEAPSAAPEAVTAVTTASNGAAQGKASGVTGALSAGTYHVRARCTGTGTGVLATMVDDSRGSSSDATAVHCPGQASLPAFRAIAGATVTISIRGSDGSVAIVGELLHG